MLVKCATLRAHWPWIVLAAIVCVGSIVCYAIEWCLADELPGGSSWSGLGIGILAGGICIFEFLLWPRKRLRGVRRPRLGAVKHWMRAHTWLGIAVAPLVALHCGFYTGGILSTILTLLVAIAIVSGIFGLVLQNRLPRQMLDQIPKETIYSEIDSVSQQHALDAAQAIARICDELPECLKKGAESSLLQSDDQKLAAASRRLEAFRRKVAHTTTTPVEARSARELLNAFNKSVYPYLVGASAPAYLVQPVASRTWFRTLRESVDEVAHTVVDDLEQLCDQRRQFEEQRRMHRLLHGWISVHLAVSVALIVLLVAHIFGALLYW